MRTQNNRRERERERENLIFKHHVKLEVENKSEIGLKITINNFNIE